MKKKKISLAVFWILWKLETCERNQKSGDCEHGSAGALWEFGIGAQCPDTDILHNPLQNLLVNHIACFFFSFSILCVQYTVFPVFVVVFQYFHSLCYIYFIATFSLSTELNSKESTASSWFWICAVSQKKKTFGEDGLRATRSQHFMQKLLEFLQKSLILLDFTQITF